MTISANSRPNAFAPSALIFSHYADLIKRETGEDPFQIEEQTEHYWISIRHLLSKWRESGTFADGSILDEIWLEYQRDIGVLTQQEQQAKDEFTLAKARTTKEALRQSGQSDAARFGYCKRTGCPYRKERSLLLRGFCSECRGVSVHRTSDATSAKEQTGSPVQHKQAHEETKRETAEERAKKVLAAKEQHPDATVREIAEQTGIPRSTVSDILKNRTVEPALENTGQTKQSANDRAENQPNLKETALKCLRNRTAGAGPAAGELKQLYVIAETGQRLITCPRCRRTVTPAYHFDALGRCLLADRI